MAISPATPSDRREVTVSQCSSKKDQATATCISATGRTMINSVRANRPLGR